MILRRNRIENKKTMNKHYCSYIEAFNLILRLSKDTLKKEYISLEEDQEKNANMIETILFYL